MEPTELPLEQEVAHDKKVEKIRNEAIIGGLVLLVLILGGVIWYMSKHPAPGSTSGQATTTPESSGTATSSASATNLNESGKYYDIKAAYPVSTSLKTSAGPAADTKAITLMKQFELNAIDAFKEQGNFNNLSAEDIKMMGFDQGRSEALEITYETRTAPHTISYVFTMYEDTLGAHPNAYFRTFTFNSKTGESLDIRDIFVAKTDYLKVLSTLSRQKLPAIIAAKEGAKVSEVDTDYMNRGTTADADNFQNWYLQGNTLVLIFPPYQVAPYAAGVQVVTIPLSSLTGLSAEYK